MFNLITSFFEKIGNSVQSHYPEGFDVICQHIPPRMSLVWTDPFVTGLFATILVLWILLSVLNFLWNLILFVGSYSIEKSE